MRIRGVHLAGLAVALVGAAAKNADAGDLTVTTATTTPVVTHAADGASAGNVTINSGGSITVTAGQTAVTVDSDNTVANSGTISSNNADNTTGIAITGVHTTSITNDGSIGLLEDYTITDTDGDGDLDGAWQANIDSDRVGIWLQSGAVMTGNITHSGTISIEGGNSYGIRLDGVLTGALNVGGTIAVTGDSSRAIAILGGSSGGIVGDVNTSGSITVRGADSIGILSDAPITGALNINGAVDVSGYFVAATPTDQTVIDALDPDDLQQSGSAVAIHYGVTQGVTLQGIGVEDDTDDDGDGITEADGDTNDNLTASISAYTSAPAVLITPDAASPVDLTLGVTSRGYGFVNRGSVSAFGIYNGFSATGVRIEGAGGSTVTVDGGMLNDGSITANSYEANAFGVYIGDGANISRFVTRKGIAARTTSETAQNSYGVFLADGANTPELHNTGLITSQVLGEIGNAYGIVDQSNTLATITNSGVIQSAVIATDNDLTDNITPVATGASVAIDVHASTIGVSVTQQTIASDPYDEGTDDDDVDDNASTRPQPLINGDVLFGSGDDSLSLLTGQMIGAASFGDGANSFYIDGGAQYLGRVTNTGTLDINVVNGFLGITGGTVNFTNGTFGAQSNLGVTLTTGADTTLLHATGTVSFAAGAVITPVLPAGLLDSGASVFLTADGGLIGADNVSGAVSSAISPYVYNTSIQVAPDDPTHSLEVSYTLKTPTELGLNVNQTRAFTPVITALRSDSSASAAFANLHTESDFQRAYNNLLPNYAAGAAELAATAIQQGQSASTNRLAATRLSQVHNQVSVWAQEIGYGLERQPQTYGLRYRGSGFGFATGIDGPLDNGALFGLTASFIASEVEEPGRSDGEIAASFGQLGAYLGTSAGPIDLDFVAGGGLGRMKSRRFIDIGSGFEAIAKAQWWAAEGHGIVRASAPMRTGAFVITPQVQLSYVALKEEGYGEEGAGALDYKMDTTLSQRLWADAGIEFAARMHPGGGDTLISPRLMLGYRANVIDNAADRHVHFANDGDPFTLQDATTGSGAPIVGLGFDATNGYSTFSLSYEGEFGDEITRHSLNASLRFRF